MCFTVVIPSKDGVNVARCISSIRARGEQCRIIVVDDGLDDPLQKLGLLEIVPGVKPFVFSRNCNIGIRAADPDDVILMNDDVTLETPHGLTQLVEARGKEFGWEFGLVSPAIRENTGQLNQLPQKSTHIRIEPRVLCFIAILIPREVWQLVGELDEQFVAYGCEDDDYCRRALEKGIRLGVWDRCLVGHNGRSSFRSGNDVTENSKQLAINRQIYLKKWGSYR